MLTNASYVCSSHLAIRAPRSGTYATNHCYRTLESRVTGRPRIPWAVPTRTPMTDTNIRIATSHDEAALVDVITLGFSTDPMARWTLPQAQQYLETMPFFVRAFGGKAFEPGTAYYVEAFAGAALWLPPGSEARRRAARRAGEGTDAGAPVARCHGRLRRDGQISSERTSLVSPDDCCGSGPPGSRARVRSPAHGSRTLRPGWTPGLSRILSPTQHLAVSAARLRGDRQDSGGQLAGHDADAPPGALKRRASEEYGRNRCRRPLTRRSVHGRAAGKSLTKPPLTRWRRPQAWPALVESDGISTTCGNMEGGQSACGSPRRSRSSGRRSLAVRVALDTNHSSCSDQLLHIHM